MDLTTLIIWIIVGAIGGWLGSMLMGTRMSLVTTIIVGIIGGLLGGFLLQLLNVNAGVSGINWVSVITAFIGSVVLIAIMRAVRRA